MESCNWELSGAIINSIHNELSTFQLININPIINLERKVMNSTTNKVKFPILYQLRREENEKS